MTTSWPRPELAAGPVCQQFRERDAGPAVSPAGAGSSMERAARRRTARRTVGTGILPQNGPGRQAEHRGLSWSWGTEVGQLPKSGFSPAGYASVCRGGRTNPRPRRRRTFRSARDRPCAADCHRSARGPASGRGRPSAPSPRDLEFLLGARGRLADNLRQRLDPVVDDRQPRRVVGVPVQYDTSARAELTAGLAQRCGQRRALQPQLRRHPSHVAATRPRKRRRSRAG